MVDFHDQYERCFLRAVSFLHKYHIAELLSHEHPEFDFDSLPNKVKEAKAIFRATNTKALDDLIKHLNENLQKLPGHPQIEVTREDHDYTLTINPGENTPKNTWIEQTANVVCGLASDIKDFRMKYKH